MCYGLFCPRRKRKTDVRYDKKYNCDFGHGEGVLVANVVIIVCADRLLFLGAGIHMEVHTSLALHTSFHLTISLYIALSKCFRLHGITVADMNQ